MSQLLFYCPDCAFRKEFSQDEIPANATQCRCPSCRKVFPIEEAIQPLQDDNAEPPALENADLGATAPEQGAAEALDSSINKHFELLETAIARINAADEFEAMYLLEEAEKIHTSPTLRSYLAYCRAKVKGELSTAIEVCRESLREEPTNSDHHLNMGRIYLLANKRGPALAIFHKGIKLGPNPQLMKEWRAFESRKPPVFPFWDRNHFINRNLGILLTRFGLR